MWHMKSGGGKNLIYLQWYVAMQSYIIPLKWQSLPAAIMSFVIARSSGYIYIYQKKKEKKKHVTSSNATLVYIISLKVCKRWGEGPFVSASVHFMSLFLMKDSIHFSSALVMMWSGQGSVRDCAREPAEVRRKLFCQIWDNNVTAWITNAKYLGEAAVLLYHITPAVGSHYCQEMILRVTLKERMRLHF